MSNSQSESDDLDWDFYLYVGITLLRWSMETFWLATPAHLLKQYIMHIKAHNPDAIQDDAPKKVYLDQTPFY